MLELELPAAPRRERHIDFAAALHNLRLEQEHASRIEDVAAAKGAPHLTPQSTMCDDADLLPGGIPLHTPQANPPGPAQLPCAESMLRCKV